MDLLRHLRFFDAIAETRHFGHAADDLRMTQPPLSQGLRKLEERLGVRLFDRSARGVSLTPEGSALLPMARDLLAAADRFDHAAAQVAEATAPLTVGVPPGLGRLSDALVGAVAAATERAVAPVLAGSRELVDAVATHQLDVAVVRHPSITDGTAPRAVHELRTRLVLPAGTDHEGFVAGGLPLAAPPRRHHPAAHDQLVDVLRRWGHAGTTVEATEAEAGALVAARAAAALSVDGTDAGEDAGALTLRVRVVTPALAGDAPAETEAVVAALEVVLAGQGR